MRDSDIMTPKIRKANLNDAEAIAKVHVQSWQETYRGHLADDLLDRLSVESRTIMWTDAMHTAQNNPNQHTQLHVAEINDEIVAFASAGLLRNEEQDLDESIEAELYAIYCLNKYQGLGIGKALLKPIVNEFVDVGFKKMLVWVLASNSSKHFYMHLGGSFCKSKEIEIGQNLYDEQAYVWESLEILQENFAN